MIKLAVAIGVIEILAYGLLFYWEVFKRFKGEDDEWFEED